jgi:WhiB family redox-sensing transcriptional regulator
MHEHPQSWRARALCRGLGSLFFPEAHQPLTLIEAKCLCAECPVTQECLDFAFEYEIEDGVWGGLSEEERKILKEAAA